jgi:hypothetical protein
VGLASKRGSQDGINGLVGLRLLLYLINPGTFTGQAERNAMPLCVRYRTNLLVEGASEWLSLWSRLMSLKKFKVVAQTDPPSADSADEQVRWGKLADVLLRPDVSKTESATTTTRAHQEHVRLKQEIRGSLDRHHEETLKRAS